MLKFLKAKAATETGEEVNVEEMIKEEEATDARAISQTGVPAGAVTMHRDHDVRVQDLTREDQIHPNPGVPILNLIRTRPVLQGPDGAGDNNPSC